MAYLHLLFSILLIGPWALMLAGLIKGRKAQPVIDPKGIPRRNKWNMILNMAVLYALSFNIVFFIQELFLALGKRWLGLPAYLYHNNHGWEGTHPMTDLAQGLGALAIFFFGIICLIILYRIRHSKHWINPLIFWLTFHGLIQSLPQISSGVVAPFSDVGLAMDYLGFSLGIKLILSAVTIGAIIISGLSLGGYFIQYATDFRFVNDPIKRMKFIFLFAFLSAAIGVVLIIPFRILPWHQATAPVMITIIGLPWLVVGGMIKRNSALSENQVQQKILIIPIVFLILLLIFFQLVLAPGVRI